MRYFTNSRHNFHTYHGILSTPLPLPFLFSFFCLFLSRFFCFLSSFSSVFLNFFSSAPHYIQMVEQRVRDLHCFAQLLLLLCLSLPLPILTTTIILRIHIAPAANPFLWNFNCFFVSRSLWFEKNNYTNFNRVPLSRLY